MAAVALLCSGTVVAASEYRAPAADAAGHRHATAAAPPIVALAAAPVAPKCWYYDTWQAPRVGGRYHEGVDIGAELGKPVFAVATGTITGQYVDKPGLRAGNALRLMRADRTYFFYAHMQGFADGITVGSKVQAGDVIGYIGQTGNALAPHLHLEIHPNGGAAVNPYPSMKAIGVCGSAAAVPAGGGPVEPEPTPAPPAPAPAPSAGPVYNGGPPVVGPAVRLGLISPVRVVDTRGGSGGKRLAANTVATYSVVGRGGVSSSASAVLVNIWASSPSAGGSLVAFSCDGPSPFAASVAYGRGQLIGNLVHVGVVNGKICVVSTAATDVIIDVVAADGSQGAGIAAIAPTRLYDSRTVGQPLAAGEVRAITASGVGGVPASNGVSLTLTAVSAAKTGTLKVWPCDRGAPGLPALVVTQGATASAPVVSRVAADGTVCVSSSVATDIVLDAMSAWAIGGASALRAVTPARVYDSRDTGGKVGGGSVLAVNIAGRGGIGGGATAVSASITATSSGGRGTVTAWPCGQNKPATATMQLAGGVTSSSTVLVGLGGGKLCLSPSIGTHLIVDVTGYAG
ncbi:MAG: M23 family metallopeptidase [Acidimicrobiia bacterium]